MNTHRYMVLKARKLEKKKSFICDQQKKKVKLFAFWNWHFRRFSASIIHAHFLIGGAISAETEAKVKEFYENDDISSLMPGLKDK